MQDYTQEDSSESSLSIGIPLMADVNVSWSDMLANGGMKKLGHCATAAYSSLWFEQKNRRLSGSTTSSSLKVLPVFFWPEVLFAPLLWIITRHLCLDVSL